MEKKLLTKFRLVRAIQTEADGEFTISFADPSASNYGPNFRDYDEFDTHQEALDHAMNSERWFQTVFTILPLYYISKSY